MVVQITLFFVQIRCVI